MGWTWPASTPPGLYVPSQRAERLLSDLLKRTNCIHLGRELCTSHKGPPISIRLHFTFSSLETSNSVQAGLQMSEKYIFAQKDIIALFAIVFSIKEAPALTSAPKATVPERSLEITRRWLLVSVTPAPVISSLSILVAIPKLAFISQEASQSSKKMEQTLGVLSDLKATKVGKIFRKANLHSQRRWQ